MNLKISAVLVMAGLLAGLYIGKSYFAVTKTVEVERQVTHTDVVTVVKEVVRPDGTKETLSTTTDRSVAKRSDTSTTVAAPPKPLYVISASYAVPVDSLSSTPVYGLQVTKQFLGPFSLGLRVQSDKQVGVVIGMEF